MPHDRTSEFKSFNTILNILETFLEIKVKKKISSDLAVLGLIKKLLITNKNIKTLQFHLQVCKFTSLIEFKVVIQIELLVRLQFAQYAFW